MDTEGTVTEGTVTEGTVTLGAGAGIEICGDTSWSETAGGELGGGFPPPVDGAGICGLPGLVPAVAGAAPVGGLDRRAGGALPGRAVTGAEPRFTGTPVLLPARSTAGGVAGTGRAGLPWPSCAVETAIAVAVTAAATAVTTVLMPAPPNS